MKIVCILQIGNELENGNLPRFLKWNEGLFDELVVIDNASSDGTYEFISSFTKHVIRNKINFFKYEQLNKYKLMEYVQKKFPDFDWVMWLDADEVIFNSRNEIENMISVATENDCDAISMKCINLWRSFKFARKDQNFDDLINIRFWKNKKTISFNRQAGLHQAMHPIGLKKVYVQSEYHVIHFGFSTVENITAKFANYFKLGQSGSSLYRIINENNLEVYDVEQLNLGIRFENFLTQQDISRLTKPIPLSISKYLEIVKGLFIQNNPKPLISFIFLIYSGVDWLEFQLSESLTIFNNLHPNDYEILIIANDANSDVIEFLEENSLDYFKAPGKKDFNEWYINSVYRAYNFGANIAKGEKIIFANSDMAYDNNFLFNLIANSEDDSYSVAKLVESGRLKSGEHAISKNFGKTLSKFKKQKFKKFSRKISKNSLDTGGLFMPSIIKKDIFLGHLGFPEGNILQGNLEKYILNHDFDYAKQGQKSIPGDKAFVLKLERSKITHKTINSSICYHFQEGEKNSSNGLLNKKIRRGVFISNEVEQLLNLEDSNYLSAFIKNIPSKMIQKSIDKSRLQITPYITQFGISLEINDLINNNRCYLIQGYQLDEFSQTKLNYYVIDKHFNIDEILPLLVKSTFLPTSSQKWPVEKWKISIKIKLKKFKLIKKIIERKHQKYFHGMKIKT